MNRKFIGNQKTEQKIQIRRRNKQNQYWIFFAFHILSVKLCFLYFLLFAANQCKCSIVKFSHCIIMRKRFKFVNRNLQQSFVKPKKKTFLALSPSTKCIKVELLINCTFVNKFPVWKFPIWMFSFFFTFFIFLSLSRQIFTVKQLGHIEE